VANCKEERGETIASKRFEGEEDPRSQMCEFFEGMEI
jgi:hypothetical protein